MLSKAIITTAVAGALALPLAGQAADYGSSNSASTGSPSTSTRGGTPGATGNASNTSQADIANTPGKPGSSSPSSGASGSVNISASEFDKLDKNHDGSLSKDEVRLHPILRGKFASLDKDHDGKLSQSELAAGSTVGSTDESGKRGARAGSDARVASNVNPDTSTRGGTAMGSARPSDSNANTANVSGDGVSNTPGTPGTSSPSAGK
jgi:EF hand domain-containing protein